MTTPALNSDIRRQLKQRLLALAPRAFELFAGDLLTFVGLQDVAVTRYLSDGGIDAYGDLISASGLMRVPTGVQVKRHKGNVQRADIDRFIGALGGRFHHGVFITTAGYAPQALEKARSSPLVRVDTVSGDQVVALMRQHQLGLQPGGASLDEEYFAGFEAQLVPSGMLRDPREPYLTSAEERAVVSPADDLISLRALSYLLRVDVATLRVWLKRGRLRADQHGAQAGEHVFFRRDRVEQIRAQFGRAANPATAAEWRQEFLDFAGSRRLTKSYKPVLLQAMLQLVDRNGALPLNTLARAFLGFYQQRYERGLVVEFGVPLLENPLAAPIAAVEQLVVRYPLERFLIQGFVEFDNDTKMVRFAPQLWAELRAYEWVELLRRADEQLAHYYARER